MRNVLKSKIILPVVSMATATSLMMGCGKKVDSTTTGSVTTSLVMTGSASGATVAQNKVNSFLELLAQNFFPSAKAYLPSLIQDSANHTIVLTKAWVVIEGIEFESEEAPGAAETDGDEVEFQGPYFVDLLDTAPSALDTQEISVKDIRRIKMKLHKSEETALPDSAPAGLLGNSLYVEGTVDGVAFVYSSEDGSEIEIGGPNAFQPGAEPILIGVQLANIFKQIDMSAITTTTTINESNRVAGSNLCASIDTSASDLFTCLRKGLEKEADMGKDNDGDGELEEGEDSVK